MCLILKFKTSHLIFVTKTGREVGGLESLILKWDGKWVVLNAWDKTLLYVSVENLVLGNG